MSSEKRKISENIFVYKFCIPLIVLFGCLIISANLPQSEKIKISFSDLLVFLLLLGAIYFSLSKYMIHGKNITIDDDNIYISNCFKQTQTAISNIAKIEKCVTFFNFPDCIIIKFKNSTKFGEKILFIPINEKAYDELDKMIFNRILKNKNLKDL
jgi:hypothetical protein